jgi:hypothetical protein
MCVHWLAYVGMHLFIYLFNYLMYLFTYLFIYVHVCMYLRRESVAAHLLELQV